MLKYIYGILRSVGLLIRICKLNHWVGCRLTEVSMQHSADGKSFLEVGASLVGLVNFLRCVGEHDELAHNLVVVHASFDTFKFVL